MVRVMPQVVYLTFTVSSMRADSFFTCTVAIGKPHCAQIEVMAPAANATSSKGTRTSVERNMRRMHGLTSSRETGDFCMTSVQFRKHRRPTHAHGVVASLLSPERLGLHSVPSFPASPDVVTPSLAQCRSPGAYMPPSLAGPLPLRDNLRLTPNTPSGLWPASASGRKLTLAFVARLTVSAAARSQISALRWAGAFPASTDRSQAVFWDVSRECLRLFLSAQPLFRPTIVVNRSLES